MATIDLKDVNDALQVVSTAIPIFGTAYSILKLIYLRTNPGKTEADFLNYLQTSSQANLDDTTTILLADGYVETPAGSGNWSKP